jgi:hypothetical protein
MPKSPNGVLRRRGLSTGVPVEETNLTRAERELLPDPSVVTEDDADAITAYRRRNQRPIPLEKALKRDGVVDTGGRACR